MPSESMNKGFYHRFRRRSKSVLPKGTGKKEWRYSTLKGDYTAVERLLS